MIIKCIIKKMFCFIFLGTATMENKVKINEMDFFYLYYLIWSLKL